MMRSHGADEEGLGDSDLDDAREKLDLKRAKFADDPGRGDEEYLFACSLSGAWTNDSKNVLLMRLSQRPEGGTPASMARRL